MRKNCDAKLRNFSIKIYKKGEKGNAEKKRTLLSCFPMFSLTAVENLSRVKTLLDTELTKYVYATNRQKKVKNVLNF